MEDEGYPLCADCARRLGRYSYPGVPELFEGYCPQCGGTTPLIPKAMPSSKGSVIEMVVASPGQKAA